MPRSGKKVSIGTELASARRSLLRGWIAMLDNSSEIVKER